MQRSLNPTLKTWFDVRNLNPPAVPFVDPKDPVKMLVLTALSAVGITEQGSDNHGQLIELIQGTIGEAQGEPWCLSFVQSCVAYVESFGYSSGLFPTEHCLTAWINSTCQHPLEPLAGDIVIYQYDGTTKGHCGLVINVQPNKRIITTIEGNTSPATKEIDREGDGIYIKERPRGGLGKMKEIGFLRPFSKGTSLKAA